MNLNNYVGRITKSYRDIFYSLQFSIDIFSGLFLQTLTLWAGSGSSVMMIISCDFKNSISIQLNRIFIMTCQKDRLIVIWIKLDDSDECTDVLQWLSVEFWHGSIFSWISER